MGKRGPSRGEIRYSRKTASRTDSKTLKILIHPVLAAILSETPAEAPGYVLPRFAKSYTESGAARVSQIYKRTS